MRPQSISITFPGITDSEAKTQGDNIFVNEDDTDRWNDATEESGDTYEVLGDGNNGNAFLRQYYDVNTTNNSLTISPFYD